MVCKEARDDDKQRQVDRVHLVGHGSFCSGRVYRELMSSFLEHKTPLLGTAPLTTSSSWGVVRDGRPHYVLGIDLLLYTTSEVDSCYTSSNQNVAANWGARPALRRVTNSGVPRFDVFIYMIQEATSWYILRGVAGCILEGTSWRVWPALHWCIQSSGARSVVYHNCLSKPFKFLLIRD